MEQGTNQNHAEVFSYQEETEAEASFSQTWSSSGVSSQDLQNRDETNSGLTSEEEDDPGWMIWDQMLRTFHQVRRLQHLTLAMQALPDVS